MSSNWRERGYALHAPNLGEGKDGPIISVRAQKRARQLGLANGMAYLIQSIAEPDAFIVPKYKNELPEVYNAPIALSPSEIRAVILFLQSLGGVANLDEIQLPAKLMIASLKPIEPFKPKMLGDVEAGQILFLFA